VRFRAEVDAADAAAVRAMVRDTGMFREDECDVAAELVRERLRLGAASGYHFLLAEDEPGALAGYACFGPIPCTQTSWDLYWIVVDPRIQRQGLGRRLLALCEKTIARLGGTHVWVDTSGSERYAPTRAFYERAGYAVAARLDDFYAKGDSKVIYRKDVSDTFFR
jgi:ribosomal protein S18 acetylase RimI-like enzyme